MSKSQKHSLVTYLLTIAATLAAVAVRFLLDPWLSQNLALVTLYGAVAFGAWFGGYRQALVAVVIGYLLCDYFFISPRGELELHNPSTLIGLLAYLVTCFIIIGFAQRLRLAQARSDSRAETLWVTIDSIGDGVIATDLREVVTFMNPVAEKLTGWKAEEASGRRLEEVFRIVDEDTRQPVHNPALRAMAEGKISGFEKYCLLIGKDGKETFIDDSGSPMRDSKGTIVGAVLIFRDVGERLKSERIRAQLAEIVRSSEDAIVSKNLNGIITSWNAAAERMFGYREEEAVGQSILIIVPQERFHEEQSILERMRRGERMDHFETIRVAKDGQQINISLTVSPMRDSTGRIIGISKVARDITQQERNRQELYENRERLRLAMEASQMGAWTRDLTAANRVECSPELERIFGLDPGEFPGTEEAFLNLIHPDDRQRVQQAVEESVRNHADYEVEFRYIRKNGGERWMVGRGRAFYDSSDRPFRVAGLGWDVTARKQAEEERAKLLKREQEARAEAETANRTKDDFLARVSHELRTPLNAILGWAHLLFAGGMDAAATRRAVEAIQQGARTQALLIDDLMDISRITSGKLLLNLQAVNLPEIIHSCLETARPEAQSKSIELETRLESTLIPIQADATRLQQVISNLLLNAVKFTPAGGHVSVALQYTSLEALITVADNGIGIEPEFLPHVFEPFQQADARNTRDHGGLGLGLSIVRHLVEAHGGSVSATSSGRGKGATFKVKLPMQPRVAAIGHTPESALAPSGRRREALPVLTGLKVLLVEDEGSSRMVLFTVLTQCGAAVTAASSVAEALRIFHQARPDAVVSDIAMPEENGYQLIARIRQLDPEQGGNVPAIAISAYARAEDHTASIHAGFQAHVSKPFEPVELARTLALVTGLSQSDEREA